MRDLRRDETWLADYAARKAALRDPRNDGVTISNTGQVSVSVASLINSPKVLRQVQAARRLEAAQREPRRMESNPARSESGSTERRAAKRACAVASGGINSVLPQRRAIANHGNTTAAGIQPGPLTPIAKRLRAQGYSAVPNDEYRRTLAGHAPTATCADAGTRSRNDGNGPIQPAISAAGATNKYHNKKTDGYASKREAKRAAELRLLLAAGEITDLREQVPFVLIPRQLDADGSVAERAVKYVADSVYWQDGQEVVEDVKSPASRTAVYKIKKKLLRFMHGITILET